MYFHGPMAVCNNLKKNMKEFDNIIDILDFAIKEEQRAADLYAGLASRSRNKEIQQVFEQFSKEELGHKKKLESIKDGGAMVRSDQKVQDLKIGDYLLDVDMKEEKAAFRLYSDLASRTDDPSLRETFLMLAQEEAKHKLRFEIEYDDYVLTEN